MDAYVAALSARDVGEVAKVRDLNAATRAGLEKVFGGMRSQQVSIVGDPRITFDGGRAQVEATLHYDVEQSAENAVRTTCQPPSFSTGFATSGESCASRNECAPPGVSRRRGRGRSAASELGHHLQLRRVDRNIEEAARRRRRRGLIMAAKSPYSVHPSVPYARRSSPA